MDWFNRISLKQSFIEMLRFLNSHIRGQVTVNNEVYENLNNLADAINNIDDANGKVSLAYDPETRYLTVNRSSSTSNSTEEE